MLKYPLQHEHFISESCRVKKATLSGLNFTQEIKKRREMILYKIIHD